MEKLAAAFAGLALALSLELIAAQLLTGAHFPEQVTWIITLAGRCGGDGGF